MAKKWVKKDEFHPGGSKGKLHRELGVSEDKPIPAAKLAAAVHSKDREIRDDAIRARTMMGWHHTSSGKRRSLYDHPESPK